MQTVFNLSTFVLNMRTRLPASLADALLGRTRAALLALLLEHPDEWFHLRQIARESGASAGTAHRELQSLVELGLLLREADGATVRFRANSEHPVFPELQGFLAKTAGAFELIRSGIARLGDSVASAFIYGSVARGEQKADSDIDLMVIGSTSLATVLTTLRPAVESLRRELNPTVYSAEEFSSKAREGHSFIERVLREPKIFLKGDASELEQLGKDRKAAPARPATRRNPATVKRTRTQPGRRTGKGSQ
ncbi:MAG TPA: helix-turn-helix domain-containing protein [Burkholderiales bacterium]|nr:helix-turn-helix domain-containing protein [Burkholderiales bacterium]